MKMKLLQLAALIGAVLWLQSLGFNLRDAIILLVVLFFLFFLIKQSLGCLFSPIGLFIGILIALSAFLWWRFFGIN